MASKYDEHYDLILEMLLQGKSYKTIENFLNEKFSMNAEEGNIYRWLKRRMAKIEARKVKLGLKSSLEHEDQNFSSSFKNYKKTSEIKDGKDQKKSSENLDEKFEKKLEKESRSETLEALKKLTSMESKKDMLLK